MADKYDITTEIQSLRYETPLIGKVARVYIADALEKTRALVNTRIDEWDKTLGQWFQAFKAEAMAEYGDSIEDLFDQMGDQLKADTLAEIQAWFDGIKDLLSEDISTTVYPETSSHQVTRTVSIPGVTSWDDVLNKPLYIKAAIYGTTSSANTLSINGLPAKGLYFPGLGVSTKGNTPLQYWVRTEGVYCVAWEGDSIGLMVLNPQVTRGTVDYEGVVRLSDKVNSTSTIYAATPNAVKKAYDLAFSQNRSVTFVIGTSTAGHVAGNVDYLCDGTADQAEINAAITALPSAGGKIILREGTYNLTGYIAVAKDSVILEGMGNSTVLLRKFNDASHGLIHITGDFCKVKDLRIDGNGDAYTNSGNDGIYVAGACADISGNRLEYCGGYGVHTVGGWSVITGNRFYQNKRSGICVAGSTNAITDNRSNENAAHGIHVLSGDNNTLTGNRCISNGDCGIAVANNYTTIVGNACGNNTASGIYGAGIDNTIVGNTLNFNAYGIFLIAQAGTSNVTGNTCKNSASGSICVYGNYNLISSNNLTTDVVDNGVGNTVVNNKVI